MRPAMRFLALLPAVLLACGNEIGDECVVSSDCSPNGDRQCTDQGEGGYCTIQGCDFNTCPEEAACIRFFAGSFANRDCDHELEDTGGPETDNCTFDELCAITNKCVARNSEIRFCMRKCESQGDCRDAYECRDLDLMRAHGGEPVLPPGTLITPETAPKFCATAGP
jgi:hypothetical protein